MKNKPTVAIGIPTLNGAANITNILSDLVNQDQTSLEISEITVHADGCVDDTQKIVKNFAKKYPFVKLIDTKERVGKSMGINNLFKSFTSDIAIILDDDTRLGDTSFLRYLCEPIVARQADLVSCPIIPVQSEGIVSRCLQAGMKLKENAIQHLNGAQNIYACRGPVRAHSKSLYKKLNLSSKAIADDMYTYLYAKSHGYRFVYTTKTQIYFQVPESIMDHRKQSIRFFQSVSSIKKAFDPEFVQNEFDVTFAFKFQEICKTLLTEHIWLIGYLFMYISNWLNNKFIAQAKNDHWDRILIKSVAKS